MAADGAATLGNAGSGLTVQQCTAKKLEIVQQGKIVVGVFGHVGLGQRLGAEIEESYSQLKDLRPEMAIGVLRTRLWNNVVGPEVAIAAQAGQLIGQQAASQSAVAGFLVALPLKGRLHLVQFDQQCSPELATEELPFATMGGGSIHADPFLSFIRKTFWPANLSVLGSNVSGWLSRRLVQLSLRGPESFA